MFITQIEDMAIFKDDDGQFTVIDTTLDASTTHKTLEDALYYVDSELAQVKTSTGLQY